MERLGKYFTQWCRDLEEEFKSPDKMFKNACNLTTKYANLIGIGRFEPNYTRINRTFVLTMIDFGIFLIFGIWSILDEWGNLIGVTFSFVTFSIGIQCGIKTFVFTSSTVSELQQYNLQRFSKPSTFPEERDCLLKTAFSCKASVEILKRAYPAIGVFTILLSICLSAVNQKFDLPYGYYIPEVNRNTLTGFLVNLSFQGLQLGFALVALLTSDVVLFNLIMNAMGQTEEILIYLRKLKTSSDKKEWIESQKLLNELIIKHVEHTRYMTEFDNLMKVGFFLNFGCLIAEAVSSLYVLATVDEIWYPGFLFVICSFYQLGISCFLGSLLATKNDLLIDEIYNTSWTKLSISEQKKLQLLLLNAQNSVVLTDGFTPINLETFMEINKTIYTYFTVLQSFN